MSRFTNTEIERGIIGSILYGVVGPDALLEFVDSEDYFTNKYLRIIYRSICRVHGRGLVVDITTISDDIINHKEIDSSHVRSYIVSIADDHGASESVFKSYVVRLLELYQERKLQLVLQNATESLRETGTNVNDVLDETQQKLFNLSERSNLDRTFSMDTTVRSVMREIDYLAEGNLEAAGFIPTYFTELDRRVLGYKRGDLIIIGGLRGEGKTQLAIQMALNQARQGHVVDIESIEMSKDALVQRLMLYTSGVSSSKVTPEKLTAELYDRIKDAGEELKELPLIITDDPSTTPEKLMARVRRLVKERGLSIVYVDYLQLMQTALKEGNREREVSHAAQMCKLIARECNVVVVALSQLTEIEDGHRPTLSTLRESKAIGHHADIVLFPWHVKKEKKSLLSIGKNRNRDIGTDVDFAFLWHNSGWWTELASYARGPEFEEHFGKEQKNDGPELPL